MQYQAKFGWVVTEADCEHADGSACTFINVIPEWEMDEHELHPGCWCEPEQPDDELPNFLVHNERNH